MKLLQTIAHVRVFALPAAWDDTARFYRDVLELDEIYTDGDAGVAVFDCGNDVTLGLERVDPADIEDAEMAGRFTGISFRVRNAVQAHTELSRRGVVFDGLPEHMEWGGILAHFQDPAGNTVTLVQEPSNEDLLGAG
jgi:catechol 2,3-dioxygenase-like lactoylglutathione lyase family enzyme